MKTFEFKHREKVRYADCDMHQHLNHASYFSFMEQARVEYIKKLGLKPGPDPKTIPFIVVSAHCDYRAPAHLGDVIFIEMGTTKIGNTSFRMDYKIKNAKTNKLLAEAYTIQVMYDYGKNIPVPFPEKLRKRIERLKK